MPKLFRRGERNLQSRFNSRVLLPPFIVLVIFAGLGFWQLDRLLRQQAIDGLSRAAAATAASLERELVLRKSILKRSGEELFVIKSNYQADKKQLEKDRALCRKHVEQNSTFADSPGGSCKQFSSGLADANASAAVIENEYVRKGRELDTRQRENINQRLAAYKQFFPETLALIVLDDKQVASSALSGVFKGSSAAFNADALSAQNQPIEGKVVELENYKLSIFAFPIAGGSVLAAYDVNNPNYLKRIWESSPVDKDKSITVFLNTDGTPLYPNVKNPDKFISNNTSLRAKQYEDIELDGTRNMAVGHKVNDTDWLVVVASPRAIVLSPLRDAQLVAVLIIGLLIVGFMWVGTYFIRRTASNIIRLVSGAMVFGSGRLDYKINLSSTDREFSQLANTMNYMAQRIADTEKAIDEKNKEFISIATHELRAPMTSVIGYLSLFKEKYDSKLDKKGKSYIDEAYYGTARLRDLVNDMLNVARLEGGKAELNLSPQPIDQVINGVVDVMGVVAKMAKVKLSYDDAHATHVTADEARLKIVVNNLVSNAIKYSRQDGGYVKVWHEKQAEHLVTIVEDNGLGIPEAQKAHIFEKFFRVQDQDRKNVTGTGLGMYITNRYVQEMNGKVWFESEHGKGTRFYFSLPVAGKNAKPQVQIVGNPNGSKWIRRWRKKIN